MTGARIVQPFEPDDDGITVSNAARIIGCDQTTIRALLRLGELEGWRVGKTRKPRGVRVSRASCEDYKDRNAIRPDHTSAAPDNPAPRTRAKRSSAVLRETLAALRAHGVRI
ncbi:MAG: hypothetical protein KIT25_12315 [Enhydrobacter sp.]|nr:MAG: hypothetical protein KIT25_12315 [Enhydrobacter sp.]